MVNEELLLNVKLFLMGEVLGLQLWRIFLALFIFSGAFLLRSTYRKILINIIKKFAFRVNIIDEHLIEALRPCIKLLFFTITMWASLYVLGIEKFNAFANSIVRILLITIATWGIYKTLAIITTFYKDRAIEEEKALDRYLVVFVGKILGVLIVCLGAVLIIKEMGYDATSIIAGLGIGGLALALGGQTYVANIFGFLTIFMTKAFKVGDWVITPDIEGIVEDIGMTSTKVRTFTQALITIPNSILMGKHITNQSEMIKRRVSFKLGVTYSSTDGQIEELCKRIRKMLEEHQEVNQELIGVYFSDFGESSLDIFIYFFTNSIKFNEYYEAKHDINLKIMRLVKDMNMSVAFPTRSIYMEDIDRKTMNVMEELKNTKTSGK